MLVLLEEVDHNRPALRFLMPCAICRDRHVSLIPVHSSECEYLAAFPVICCQLCSSHHHGLSSLLTCDINEVFLHVCCHGYGVLVQQKKNK